MNNKALLHCTGSYIQYPVVDHNGKEYEKDYVLICAPKRKVLAGILDFLNKTA